MNAPRLSICIPTYNFGQYIAETLESMLHQIRPGVEIVVLDSGSSDNTSSVMSDLQTRHSCLRYNRVPDRQGIDRDMARVVELARGEYCWLFSADDLMAEGALSRVLTEINLTQDVYLCAHSNETLAMQLVSATHPIFNLSQDFSCQLDDLRCQLTYFRLAVTTEAFFSFISGLIIRKAKWDSVRINEAFVGTCWAHVARLFEIIPSGLNVKFIASALVRRRGENDSFAMNGVVRRYALAIEGYQNLAAHFWGKSSNQAFHIRRVLRNEFRLRQFLEAKALCSAHPERENRHLLDKLVVLMYSDWTFTCLINRFVYWLFPTPLYSHVRAVYRFVRRRAMPGTRNTRIG